MGPIQPVRSKPPASDVSATVGWSGVAGLALWVLICHFWPDLAAYFGATRPVGRLSGPYAALTGLVAAAGPMIVVSLVKDKVHRRLSTGID